MNTFSGSMKNARSHANCGPKVMTWTVSTQAARKVPRLKATLTSGAESRWPTAARTMLPTSGRPNTNTRISISVFFELFQVLDVEAVELLENLEHEHAQDQDAHQHIERDAQLDDHR